MYEKGYNSTGIQEIVNEAGIPKGSFYNYFESKEDFAIQAINMYTANNKQFICDILDDKSMKPTQRVMKLYTTFANFFAQKEYKLGCFNLNLCQEMADVNIKIATSLDHSLKVLKDPLTKCLREAYESGDLDNSQDVEMLSEFIYNSWGGAIVRMKASKNAEPLNAFLSILDKVLLK